MSVREQYLFQTVKDKDLLKITNEFNNFGDFCYTEDGTVLLGVFTSEKKVESSSIMIEDMFSDEEKHDLKAAGHIVPHISPFSYFVNNKRRFSIIPSGVTKNSIIVNGKQYSAFEEMSIRTFVYNNNNKFANGIFDVFEINAISIDYFLNIMGKENLKEAYCEIYVKFYEETKDLIDYASSLVSHGGDGYSQIFTEELDGGRFDAFADLYDIFRVKFNKFISESYFSYDDSKIQDLSIYRNERIFDVPSQVSLMSVYDFIQFFFEVVENSGIEVDRGIFINSLFGEGFYGSYEDRK